MQSLTALGKPALLQVYPNSGHGFLIYQNREKQCHGTASVQFREARRAWQDVVTFLRQQLG
ncbi:MAG: dienelactone hydrolase family protein [Aphanocapsa lilacina HA4352-LM1]|nr:dienelactone hydrolase family protein [Aphanocapsa lilacina HA4352-LM1]